MLTIENLTSGYGESDVLRGLDLQVPKGQIVAIMGRNGMGKTTLMKSLMGIVPATGGTIRVDDRQVGGAEIPRPRRRWSGLCPAGSADLFRHDGARKRRDRPDRDRQEDRARRHL